MTKKTGTKEELIEEIQTRGAWAAYLASREVCENPNAPANARAQAASNILRAAGFFALTDDSRRARKEPSEMTPDELAASIAELDRERSAAGSGVFD